MPQPARPRPAIIDRSARAVAAPMPAAVARAILPGGTALLATLLLAGCAGLGGSGGTGSGAGGGAGAALPELPAAQGAASPTAIVEMRYTLDGALLPVVRGETRSSTRADMRRNDSLLTFDNWLIRQVAGDGRNTDITRVDRRLVWSVEHSKRQYSECPITGCAAPSKPGSGDDSKREPSKPSEPDCPVTVKTNRLDVTPAGERRNVNGFATDLYRVAWTVELEDRQNRRNSNRVAMDLWTTPEAGPIREVQQLDEAYARRYAAALSTGENPLGRYLPRDVMAAMNRFAKGLDSKDARTLSAMAAEMRKVRGYPIVTTLSWTSEGSVCADSSPAAAASTGGIGGLLGAITGNKPAGSSGAPTPLVTYTSEVKTVTVRPVGDNAFVPPADYQRKP